MLVTRSKALFRASIAAAMAVILTSFAANAQTSPTAVRLDYAATDACPDRDAFANQLRMRAHRVRIDDAAAGRLLTVRIAGRPGRYAGKLSVEDPDGKTSERSVDGKSCNQVVTALALIAALVLDPAGRVESTGHGEASTSGPSDGAGNSGGSGAGSATPSDKSPEKKPDRETSSDASPQPASSSTPPKPKRDDREAVDARDRGGSGAARPTWQISLGADAEASFGLAPRTLGTLVAFFEVAQRAPERLLAPALRIRFERPGTDGDTTSQGSAHFTWTEASLDLSPVAWWPRRGWRLQPALRTEAGVVEGAGVGTAVSHDETRPWLTFGAVVSSRWDIVGPLFVELEAALVVPIIRDRFYLDPTSTTVFQSSPVGATIAGGLGVSIW